MPINDIIEKHFGDRGPDFIWIDAESKNVDILNQLDLERYKPKLICFE